MKKLINIRNGKRINFGSWVTHLSERCYVYKIEFNKDGINIGLEEKGGNTFDGVEPKDIGCRVVGEKVVTEKTFSFTFPQTIVLSAGQMRCLENLIEENHSTFYIHGQRLVELGLIEYSASLSKKRKANTWIPTKLGLLCLMRAK